MEKHRRIHVAWLAAAATAVAATMCAAAPARAAGNPAPASFDAPPISSFSGTDVERAGVWSMAHGDFTGNGRTDIAAVAFGGAAPGVTKTTGVLVALQAADGRFVQPVEYPAGRFPIQVVTGHLRGPAAPLDLVVVDAGTDASGVNGIAVLLGNGDGTFQAPRMITFPGSYVGSVGVGDLNGDGRDDIVANASSALTSGAPHDLSVLLSNGDGTFAPPVAYQAGDGLSLDQQVTVVDVNHDGHADVLTLDSDGMWLSLGNGDGTLQPGVKFWDDPSAAQTNNISGPTAFAVGDLTGSGNVDIALEVGGVRVDVLRNSGTGVFAPFGAYDISAKQGGFGGGTIAAADLTGHGHLDLVAATGFGGTLAVLRNSGNGLFSMAPLLSPLPEYDDDAMVVTPLGGDHLPDVAVFTGLGLLAGDVNFVTTLRNRGDGTFAAPSQYPVVSAADNQTANPTNPIALTTGDFNGDGHPDVAVTLWDFPAETLSNGQVPTPPTLDPTAGTVDTGGSIAVLLNKGDGTLGTETQYRVGARPIAITSADLTGDGHQDLVVANGAENTLSLLQGNGDGTFQPAVTVTVGNNPTSLAVADLNGDGRPDIAVTNLSDNTVDVLRNTSAPGKISFAAPVSYAVGQNPDGVVAADLTGSGHLDLAVAAGGVFYPPTASTLTVLRGAGDGSFAPLPQQVLTKDPGVSNLVALHPTASGAADLAFTQFADGTVTVLDNNRDGTFSRGPTYRVGAGPEGLVATDLNGDGQTDLAVSDLNDGTVAVLLGNGDGTFVPASNPADTTPTPFGVAAFAYPTFLAAGDLSGSGLPDLVTGNIFLASITVLRNTTPTPNAVLPEVPLAVLLVPAGVAVITADAIRRRRPRR
ncbi:MAG: FG-GAP repeat domain-containing protein [Candidatus Dormibacteria bacterium]